MLRLRTIHHATDGRITAEDYAVVRPWWEARGGEAPSREMLPTFGVIAEQDGQPVACAFCYLDATGSGVAMLGWLATRPGSCAHKSGRAMLHLFRFIEQEAERLNYWLLMATYHRPSVVSTLKRLGFRPADTGMVQLFKKL